ncbi:SRPBCC family protein [Longitalea luteola]|uniref:SRPBCC family protein n=1 Tax=Longitalea luteola TaxID=2812563 RepID=UPI001F60D9F0|nr:SRPBCC domain-containing protein [Longitalea luteola]
MTFHINNTVTINAPASIVWTTITQPHLMKQWMGDASMQLDIRTSWAINSAIIIAGFHHLPFENKGTVLQFEPGKRLQYSHLSSLSRLPDEPHNYSIVTFELNAANNATMLTLTIDNFPTETIYRHLAFYWQTTIVLIKKFIEENLSALTTT